MWHSLGGQGAFIHQNSLDRRVSWQTVIPRLSCCSNVSFCKLHHEPLHSLNSLSYFGVDAPAETRPRYNLRFHPERQRFLIELIISAGTVWFAFFELQPPARHAGVGCAFCELHDFSAVLFWGFLKPLIYSALVHVRFIHLTFFGARLLRTFSQSIGIEIGVLYP